MFRLIEQDANLADFWPRNLLRRIIRYEPSLFIVIMAHLISSIDSVAAAVNAFIDPPVTSDTPKSVVCNGSVGFTIERLP